MLTTIGNLKEALRRGIVFHPKIGSDGSVECMYYTASNDVFSFLTGSDDHLDLNTNKDGFCKVLEINSGNYVEINPSFIAEPLFSSISMSSGDYDDYDDCDDYDDEEFESPVGNGFLLLSGMRGIEFYESESEVPDYEDLEDVTVIPVNVYASGRYVIADGVFELPFEENSLEGAE